MIIFTPTEEEENWATYRIEKGGIGIKYSDTTIKYRE